MELQKPAIKYNDRPAIVASDSILARYGKLFVIVFSLLMAEGVEAQQSKPNIVVIMLDDARYDMFAPNGGPAFFSTPSINRIAEEGVNFRFTGVTTSLCAPSRASIYTGLYAHHHGTLDNGTSPNPGLTYVSSVLQDNGYKTAFIGKWLLDFHIPDDPVGFDFWAVTDSIEHDSMTIRFDDGSLAYYIEPEATVYTDLGLNFVENMVPDGSPWALFLFYRYPHSPYEPYPGEETLYQQANINYPENTGLYTKDFPSYLYPGHLFEGDSTDLDQAIRDYYETGHAAEYAVDSVMKYLEAHQILDSTLIIFSSDNGYLLGEHGMEKKILAYEESLRVPLFVRYPAWFQAGTVIDNEIAANIDIASTLLEAAGIPDTFNMDGVSLHQLAQGQVHRKYFYYENYPEGGNKWEAVRSLDYTYIYSLCNSTTEEFFDLINDPQQNINLINDPAYAALIQIHRDQLDSLRLSTGDTTNFKLGKCKLENAYFADADGDTYGNFDIRKDSVAQPIGYVTDTTDCNDSNAQIHPGAAENCNGLDDNCNGLVDEGLVFTTYYTDADDDGFGNLSAQGVSLCNNPGAGYAVSHDDCNDANAAIHPSATELCNTLDDNCNGSIDEGLAVLYFPDIDGDGYGDLLLPGELFCNNPGSGFSIINTDCNDLNPEIHPDLAENCNGTDDNCNGLTDEGLSFITYYSDIDLDTYGNISDPGNSLCADPGAGFSVNHLDCNDGDAAINPAAIEICNAADDDCNGSADDALAFITYYIDQDNDAYGNISDPGNSLCADPGSGFSFNHLDCNDGNATINPAAIEICNAADDDCNGSADDGLAFNTYYIDQDNDAYGNISDPGNSLCADPGSGFSVNHLDCNDGNATINPAAFEICNAADDDCNGSADDGLAFNTYYIDQDNDAYGNISDPGNSLCADPGSGFSVNHLDCNDGNATINPAAFEICNAADDDCNGSADDGLAFNTYYIDQDNDAYGNISDPGNSLCADPGSGFSFNHLDCNDGNATINPAAIEICNAADDDCNGSADDGLAFITYYIDQDNDAYGNISDPGNSLCADPGSGFSFNHLDCNDGNATINPAAIEICNAADDDCNGSADDGLAFITYYIDQDNDAYGNISDPGNSLCADPGSGFSVNHLDCNDANATINPAAFEICNAADDDCNGSADDGLAFITYYIDQDNDAYGNISDPGNSLCADPGSGFSVNHLDCNDGNAAINPAAFEICNAADDDCNGSSDDGLAFITYYIDQDNDAYGNISDPGNSLCVDPGSGFSVNHLDCNDGNAAINPVAAESCNTLDDNCNGTIDDGIVFIIYYADNDIDGFGSISDPGNSLCNNPGIGFSANNSDCNDTNAFIHPLMAESCNAIDDNCNGISDEGLTFNTYYADQDNDGFGNMFVTGATSCIDPGAGFAINNFDCYDLNALINPNAAENCNGIDDNCNGNTDEGLNFINYYADNDNDGFGNILDPGINLCYNPGAGHAANNSDCNDASAAINPSALETCNGIDDNCNGSADDGLLFTTYYADLDNDTFGDLNDAGTSLCSNPGIGFAIVNTDCNDANATINPAAAESCDGIDDNCNGSTDDGMIFTTYYADLDNDSFGDLNDAGTSLCNNPGVGFAIVNTDCNDANANINPAAVESCDGIDDNCNGTADDGLVFTTYYADLDNDNFGDLNDGGTSLCNNPGIGFAVVNTDCNDGNASINPAAIETCNGIDDNCNGSADDGLLFTTYYADLDNDTFGDLNDAGTSLCNNPGAGFSLSHSDCNDGNASVNPAAVESCNGIDDNCNGTADDAVGIISYYADADGDGFGNPAIQIDSCAQPAGFVLLPTDCNDAIASINPAAPEICNTIDDNCSGSADEGLFVTYYTDADGDGFGNQAASGVDLCSNPGTGFAINNLDCNDASASINPSATETCNSTDDDCDGTADDGLVFTTYYPDQDHDGYGKLSNPGNTVCYYPGPGFVTNHTDCNDGNIAINPGAAESCNNIDDNCNGTADDGLVFITYYADQDHDTYGNVSDPGNSLCADPGSGFSVNHLDCNDNNAIINPAASESCNSIDDNCNGATDDGLVYLSWYIDLDNDSYGNTNDPGISACSNPGTGFVLNNSDCNDENSAVNPGAAESCNGSDDNCNGITDEGLVFTTYFPDTDQDGFGDAFEPGISLCNQPGNNYVENNDDCYDYDAAINPDAPENCNALDDNCNGLTDEGLIFTVYYTDLDQDGFGNILDPGTAFCVNPGNGYAASNTDCNDINASINPAAAENCNGIDDNCNGTADDGLAFTSYYADLDHDTFGDLNDAGTSLCNNPGFGFSSNHNDCNDNNASINPAAAESCNGIDDNCNGTADDGLVFTTYYADLDNDNFGDLNDGGTSLCNNPGVGFAIVNTDCDDGSAVINPAAIESCNGIDDNCNGTADDGLVFTTYYADLDNDNFGDLNDGGTSLCNIPGIGFAVVNTDCNDGNASINPNALESCNGIDDNCNTLTDDGIVFTTYYLDLDHDAFGNIADPGTSLCIDPGIGFAVLNTDCDDANASVNPTAIESCNGIDDNCNGSADDGLVFTTYFADLDNDSFGDLNNAGTSLCSNPGIGFAVVNTDCDDANAFINPAAAESCNGIDDNCNGTADDGLVFVTYYPDQDGDGYGDFFLPGISLCNNPGAGFANNNTDCYDINASIHPNAAEICNSLDDNCNGSADDGLVFTTYYADLDNDSFGDLNDTGTSLCSNPGIGFAIINTDCNDANATINPAAAESCDGIDDNCNGSTDDGLVFTTYYADLDNDTFGDLNDAGTSLCNNPGVGFAIVNTDCNDANANINPAAAESCDGIDDNCNGSADDGLLFTTYYADLDNDTFGDLNDAGTSLCNNPGAGFSLSHSDCNDGNASINPAAIESCNGIDDNCNGSADDGLLFTTYYADLDNDTFGDLNDAGTSLCNNPGSGFAVVNTDCNDGNAFINPAATETCNGIDDNCNGTADDAVGIISYYADADGDGFGNPAIQIDSCAQPAGFVLLPTDCNDAIASINPAAPEICNTIDDNCSGSADEGLFVTYYTDADGDGFGNQAASGVDLCSNPGTGFAINNLDCNDASASINPSATETCNSTDDDCDGTADDGLVFTTYYPDQDHDGYGKLSNPGNTVCYYPGPGFVTNHTDCNDGNIAINPGAAESCNNIDDNCNGTADDGLVFITYYADQDHDTYGNVSDPGNSLCADPGSGFSVNHLDCNDNNAIINPAASESCNGIDDNCNGATDDGLVYVTYYPDQDGDGYGDFFQPGINFCNDPGNGFAANNTDCYDINASIHPDATEICNGIDDNCNGTADDGLVFTTYYADLDNDTFGDLNDAGISLCSNPGSGFSVVNTDCNDGNAAINPVVTESCNGIDDNCNGSADDGLVFTTYYADLDNDTFGDLNDIGTSLCNNPGSGFSVVNTDCNDGNALINPTAIESCNGIDDNCNGSADDGLVFTTYYADLDNDSFGDLNDAGTSLCNNPGIGFAVVNTDCDDGNALINPTAIESCNGIDDNCNGSADDGLVFTTYYADLDNDSFGDLNDAGTSLCSNPGSGFSVVNTDCNDGNAAINPAVTESCNGIDDNCTGSTDDGLVFTTYYADLDNDTFGDLNDAGTSLCSNPGSGFSVVNTDCNDGNAAINPAVTESCNGIDDNCNGTADDGLVFTTYYADLDFDGFGDLNDAGTSLCNNPGIGFAVANTDCDDGNASINPTAIESCNGIDDNCNGSTDDGLVFTTYYTDLDNDSFGDLNDAGISLCNNPGIGFAVINTDCNDANASINPAAIESCNGIDDNCNGTADDGLVFVTYYPDQDGDGYGDFFLPGISLCNNPGAGFANNNTDCYDINASIHPNAAEICNSIDDNCNGAADDGLVFTTYYTDLDNDTFGDLNDAGTSFCSNPGIGFAIVNTDCNDANATINPAAAESCNGIDDNCNGTADDGLVFTTYFADLDNDSFGDLNDAGTSLCSNPGIGFAIVNTDCNDANANINPAAAESCDGIDDNCNGTADDGLVFTTYYADLDNDNFGDLNDGGTSLCNNPGIGFAVVNTDCNDGNSFINPTAIETCNGIDDNCNGSTDDGLVFTTYYADLDNDTFGDLNDAGTSLCNNPGAGFSLSHSDCNDGNASINPAAIESCNGIDDNCNGSADDGLLFTTYYADLDNDTFGDLNDAGTSLCNNPGSGFAVVNTDCNDGNAFINPAATETCNGIDDNCNGTADDAVGIISYYADADGDGFGNPAIQIDSCAQPAGFVLLPTDCNDAIASINPAAPEICNTIDDNCSGSADEGLFVTYYTDADGDGFGNQAASGVDLCSNPGTGFAINNLDCNDASASINPSATETCNSTDDDCDGTADDGLVFTTYYVDQDNDSFGDLNDAGTSLCNNPGSGFTVVNTDCNDGNASINPAASESCNGIDDNCNGSIDDGLVFTTYFADLDNDSFGDLNDIGTSLCSNPGIGFAVANTDCNDSNASINPSVIESCNGFDDNCNGAADDGLVFTTYYADFDNDTFGDLNDAGTSLCNNPGIGFAVVNTDCNDGNASINPTAIESCNGIDDNCNGTADDGLVFVTYYPDQDSDGYGDFFLPGISLCNNPGAGFANNNTDCYDINASIHPNAAEICNSIDDNCNGAADDGLVFTTYYADLDNDTFGDLNDAGISLCSNPGSGFSVVNTDCNDGNAAINPVVTESCNGIDDNCNGSADDGLVFTTYYADLDFDGFGDLNDAGTSLCNNPGIGFAVANTDCDDGNASINPTAIESCNGIDDNCNGSTDDGLVFTTYFADLDNDTFGDLNDAGTSLCSNPGIGFVEVNTDCNDGNALINPTAIESCNGIDDNCNGSADDGLVFTTYYADLDNDSFGDLNDAGTSLCSNPGSGFAVVNTDCDDGNASINPTAIESCNGIDDNCNGTADDGLVLTTYFVDLDNDTFGDLNDIGTSLCSNPGSGFAVDNTDCNDGNAAINPAATESCNGIDDNCNGSTDDGLVFTTYYADLDNDSFGDLNDAGTSLCSNPGSGFAVVNTDCDDGNASINPAVIESCNGIDDNCNGSTDDGLVFTTYYADLDNDTFGDLNDAGTSLCSNPGIGFAVVNTDCDDGNASINPAVIESCNGIDDNCSGTADDGLVFTTYYADLDNDTFGDLNDAGTSLCSNPGIGFAVVNTDCDDGNAAINPAATESCNGIDDNCNGTADDGLVFTTYYADLDNDSFGDLNDPGTSLCSNPGIGFAVVNTDCDDGNTSINPAATESCNGIDDNCNGSADDGLVFTTYYADLDNDTFGDLNDAGTSLCSNPGSGFSVVNTDCNDGNAAINPAVTESCNGIDDNCNGTADDGLVFTTYYADLDNDTFGDLNDAGTSLCSNPGSGFSVVNTDCNDGNAVINPVVTESCNGIDDNCNGTADDGLVFTTYYADLDNDTFGDLNDAGTSLCNNPGIGFAVVNTDCDDGNALINPTAIESCNGIDDNCNGSADDGLVFTTYYADLDNDTFGDLNDAGTSLCSNPGNGFSVVNTDCNDGNAVINPVVTESCNGIDDNCNGTADDGLVFTPYYADLDFDGFGDLNDAGTSLCNNPGIGFAVVNTDCDDGNASINPAVIESCNGIDDNCNGSTDDGLAFTTYYADLDNDSFGDLNDAGTSLCNNPGIGFAVANTDCDDGNASINPAVIESCNGIDDNCNGSADDGLVFTTYYADLDNDSFGDLNDAGTSLCSNPGSGFAIVNTDCNDGNSFINPAATESCNGIDDNCNGTADDGLVFTTYYADLDNDTFGDLNDIGTSLCSNPGIGFAVVNNDCNDGNASINPAATETCNGIDDNCNGSADDGLLFTTYYDDLDNDTFGDLNDAGTSLCSNPGSGFAVVNTDCDDGNASINPTAIESCNGIDDNCNGTADDGLVFTTYYADLDNDSYGSLADPGTSLCSNPGSSFAVVNTDCDDGNASINPAVIESCNGIDDNCNGSADDGLVFTTYYADLDNDSFGDLNDAGTSLCSNPGIGFAVINTDCNDGNASINPAAIESCNGIDDNCNGTADDGLVFTTYYADLDNDTFGDLNDAGTSLCSNPGIGFAVINTDCNDGNASINPAAIESCNGIDDNCNGTADDGLVFTTYYADLDNDTFGDLNDIGTSLCSNPGIGFAVVNNDCNDGNASINPAATETCNGIDDNCNGSADDGLLFTTYYDDLDNDTFGDLNDAGTSLCSNPGSGFAVVNTDCDDGNASINPTAIESCNGIDDNCNGTADDGLVFTTYFVDLDNDTFGDLNDAGTSLCSNPGIGFAVINTDCNDGNASINPAAIESCNGIDDNCNGTADDGLVFTTYYADLDNDSYGSLADPGTSLCSNPGAGYSLSHNDCNDNNAAINPSASETCNGIDDNCNGTADDGLVFTTYYLDQDNDSYGSLADAGTSLCNNPGTGYATNHTDCNDANALINPAGTETCNTLDDNCNGSADEGLIFINYYPDADNDNFGNQLNAGISLCSNPGTGYSVNNEDCNDNNAFINPAVTESCNGIDDNCNDTLDEGFALTLFYQDADNDTFGDSTNQISACEAPAGYVADSTDCNDNSATVNPGAPEILPNGVDDDCDGYIDEISVGIATPQSNPVHLDVYPNPTDGDFVIYLQLPVEVDVQANIELRNLIGQVKLNKSVQLHKGKLAEEMHLNSTDASGIYYLTVTLADHVYTAQIVYQQ
ncbi:MAG: sulfatase-like hydrolase/transferase [Chitinophagales bacterium]|nr:sulfatase-like hydrolase/transferase [Chitinophagales bacterium]